MTQYGTSRLPIIANEHELGNPTRHLTIRVKIVAPRPLFMNELPPHIRSSVIREGEVIQIGIRELLQRTKILIASHWPKLEVVPDSIKGSAHGFLDFRLTYFVWAGSM